MAQGSCLFFQILLLPVKWAFVLFTAEIKSAFHLQRLMVAALQAVRFHSKMANCHSTLNKVKAAPWNRCDSDVYENKRRSTSPEVRGVWFTGKLSSHNLAWSWVGHLRLGPPLPFVARPLLHKKLLASYLEVLFWRISPPKQAKVCHAT